MKDEEKMPNRKRANTSLEKEKREKQKLTKKKKSVMEKTIEIRNKKLLGLKAGYNQHTSPNLLQPAPISHTNMRNTAPILNILIKMKNNGKRQPPIHPLR
jgi:hypothetical protein